MTRQPTYTGPVHHVERIVYINLDRSTDRRAALEASMADLVKTAPVPPLFRLAAIDGGALATGVDDLGDNGTAAFVEQWLSRVPFPGNAMWREYQRTLTGGRNGVGTSLDGTTDGSTVQKAMHMHASEEEATEPNTLACYMSHVLALHTILSFEEGLYLVLEDDARLSDGWDEALAKVRNLSSARPHARTRARTPCTP